MEKECPEFDPKEIIAQAQQIVMSEESEGSGQSQPSEKVSPGVNLLSLSSGNLPDSTDSSSTDNPKVSPSVCHKGLDEEFERFCLEKKREVELIETTCIMNSTGAVDSVHESQTISNINSSMDKLVSHNTSTDKVSLYSNYFDLTTDKSSIQSKHQTKSLKNADINSFLYSSNSNKNIESSEDIPFKDANSYSSVDSNLSETVLTVEKKEGLKEDSTILNEVKKGMTNKIESDEEDVLIPIEQKKCFPDSENNFSDTSVVVSSPTLSQWSRGEVTTSSGSLVKGSSALTNGCGSPQISQGNRSVSSQMGCKEMSAFTKFARDMRKKILNENPDMSFTRVAQQLQVQWRHLNSEEKRKYEETVTVKKVCKITPDKSQKTLTALATVPTKKRADIELDVDMDILNQLVKSSKPKYGEVCLIGQLEASPLWFFYHSNMGLKVVSVARLKEAVKFHQYLNSFAVPIKLLDDYIPFCPSDVGESEWCVMLDLERSPNGIIRDVRLVNNGFYVEVLEGELEARLTYVPQHISFCGVEELREILQLLRNHGPQASLMQSRPLKVISSLRSEVMRECSKEESPCQPEEVSHLLDYWLRDIAVETQTCIHHLPVTKSLDPE